MVNIRVDVFVAQRDIYGGRENLILFLGLNIDIQNGCMRKFYPIL